MDGNTFHETLRNAGFSRTIRNPYIVQLELNLDLILYQANRPSLLRQEANNGVPLDLTSVVSQQ